MNPKRLLRPLCIFVLLFGSAGIVAAEPPAPLTVERIFNSGEFDSQNGPSIHWRAKGGYTTLQGASGRSGRDLVQVDPATGKEEILIPSHRFTPKGEEQPLSIEEYSFSHDESKVLIFTNSKRVWRQRSRGDYWVLDVSAGELKKLGGKAAAGTLQFAKFSPDGTRVAYVREGNLYVQDLATNAITALTSDGSKNRINGTFDWVYEEELSLRDGFRWSPDGTRIAYWQIDDEGVREFPLVNNLAGLYPSVLMLPYPKVGERNPSARIGVVPAAGGPTEWLNLPGDPREHYVASMEWLAEGTSQAHSDALVVQQFNRLQNTNNVFITGPGQHKLEPSLTEKDDAWVEASNIPLRWFGDGSRFLWLSERDGWNRAYVGNRSGELAPITTGPLDVVTVETIDSNGDWVYFIASPDNPTQAYLYRAKVDGTGQERLTPAGEPGSHSYQIAPSAEFAVHTYSRYDKPPIVEMIHLPDHKVIKVLANNEALQKKLDSLSRRPTEFFKVDIGNGVQLDGWCMTPPDFDSSKKYPVIFYVYGEPAGQTVVDRWSGRRYLWHLMLAQQGYVVMSVDNRGTPAPRGRAWRKSVYRQIGILSSADQAAALTQLLKDRPYLDATRVGVWGWSGGGSMTLNLMFRSPDLYHVGLSIAPVPNQRLYDTIYQERYQGLPGDNAEGYRNGSPLTFAKNLKGKLLVIHGTGDDNCHYQGAEALFDELIAHNKPFQMFAYPFRSHSISERTNTTRHLYSLMTRYFNESLPAGAK